eukprot:1063023-Rhodomonas_salina.1
MAYVFFVLVLKWRMLLPDRRGAAERVRPMGWYYSPLSYTRPTPSPVLTACGFCTRSGRVLYRTTCPRVRGGELPACCPGAVPAVTCRHRVRSSV